jgi:hypothetical protein
MAPIDQLPAIATVHEHRLDGRHQRKQPDQHCPGANPILYPGRMHDHGQNESHRIYRNVLLAPLDLLAGIEAALPPCDAVLADRESTMATEGSALRSACCLTSRRKACITRSQVPSMRQLRKYVYTVFQGGKSAGNIRHWHPLLSTYSMAFTSRLKSCLVGRPRSAFSGKGLTRKQDSFSHSLSVKSLGYINSPPSHDVTRYRPLDGFFKTASKTKGAVMTPVSTMGMVMPSSITQ